MKFTNEVEYGFRIIYCLACAPKDKIMSSVDIATQEQVPHLFGLRILKKLETAGLVEVFKGARGGYRLKKDAKRISLKDVIEAIEEKINLTSGIAVKGECSAKYEKSGVRKQLVAIEKNFAKELDSISFADLTKKNK